MAHRKEEEDFKLSSFMVIKCMMEPLKQGLKSCEELTTEQLVDNVQTLEAIVHIITATSHTSIPDESDEELDQVIVTLVKDVCLPILCSLHIFPDSANRNSEKIKSRSVTVHGISSCFCHIKDKNVLCELIFQVIFPLLSLSDDGKDFSKMLKDQGFECPSSPENLDIRSSLEILVAFLNDHEIVDTFLSNMSHYNFEEDVLLKKFYFSLTIISEKDNSAFSKSLNAVSKLLNVCSTRLRRDLLSEVWHKFAKPLPRDLDGNVVRETLWQSLFAFYCFKDFLFPLEKFQSDILSHHLGDEFWICIQSGFLSSEPSHRKLSMYLLKRLVDTCHQNGCIVNVTTDHKGALTYKPNLAETERQTVAPMFWWYETHSPLLLEAWEDFILLMETLEEKQVHVIKPVLSRMSKLVSLYSKPSFPDGVYLHTSWLMIIFIRCFHHESHFMSRWGAVTLLNLDFQQVPLIRNGQMKFLSQDLLEYLQENKLYSRYTDTELGKCSPVGEGLLQFFVKLFAVMDHSEKVEYLGNVLQKVLDNTWGSIPVVFLAQGLSNIPPEPILDSASLSLIRDILQTCLTSHELQTRGASQCFFGQMIMNLVDLDSVGLLDFFTTLAWLSRDESFKRGICLWENMADFLQNDKVTSRWDDKQILSIAYDYLKESTEEDKKSSVIFSGSKVISISRMLLLFADAKMRTSSMTKTDDSSCPQRAVLEKCPLGVILNEMQSVMSNIRSRSYISIARVDSCLAVLQCLGKDIGDVSQSDHVGLLVKEKLAQSFQYAVSFVVRRMSQDLTKPQDLEEIEFYCDVISTLGSQCPCPLQSLQELLAFVTGAFNLTTQPSANAGGIDMVYTSAMKILHQVLKIVHTHDTANNKGKDVIRKTVLEMRSFKDLPLPFSKGVVKSEESFSKAQVGYVISSFLSSKWHCYKLMLLLDYESLETVSDLELAMENSMDALTLGSGRSDVAVFGVLQLLMEKMVTHCPSLVPALLDLAWGKVMEENKNNLFWHKFEALVPVALNRFLLEPQVDQVVTAAVDEVIEKIFSLGREKSGVIYLMVKHLCDSALTSDEGRQTAKRLIPLLLQACDFGTVHKKGQRLWLDVTAYLESLGATLASNQITSSIAKNDISTRIVVLNWLSKLKPTIDTDHGFVMEFLRALSDRYLEYAEATTYRHFINSLSHRQKHRMSLVFVLLSDFIQEGDCEEFLSKLKTGLELECHPSVTHNLEWTMMRIFIRYPSHLSSLWDSFSQFVQRRSICLCSLFLIICHIGPKLPKVSQLEFYNQAFPTVIPWTMAHHYTTRIFAQTCLTCLWQQCLTLDLGHVLEKFALIKPTVEFLSSNINASNTIAKLQDNFVISGFDPIRDFSAETIFCTLPRLALISDDEWISPQRLFQEDEVWQEGSKLIPLHNASTHLSKCKEGPWKIKPHVDCEDDTTRTLHGDFQKKIMPWRQMAPEDDTENELATERRETNKDGLILVTSLIDKLPNLGGLCRTSEIFGVTQFIIGNLKYLEDRMFQSLSVSAQKWLSITEVIRPRLPDYLAAKRRDGYTLVGVEQTANSVCLDEYTFPKKSLLVLGNEKEGIPPDMIQTLDICVEIPQQGIIRSLNVHVCGALIVWEYTRQHLKSPPLKDGQS